MVHPSTRTLGVHDASRVHFVMKIQSMLTPMIDATASHGVDPVRCLGLNVMFLTAEIGKGFSKPFKFRVVIGIDACIKIGDQIEDGSSSEQRIELPIVERLAALVGVGIQGMSLGKIGNLMTLEIFATALFCGIAISGFKRTFRSSSYRRR